MFESELTILNNDVNDIKMLIERGLEKIIEINHNLEKGSLLEVRNEIGSIFREKMRFEKSGV